MPRVARRSQKPWKQARAVGTAVESVLGKLELRAELIELNVRNAWTDAVGESIARRSAATKLAQGTLVVTVESPTWKNELTFIEADIIKRVNECFQKRLPGSSAKTPVKKLRLQVGALPPPPKKKEPPPPGLPPATAKDEEDVERRLEGVTDPEVRAAARAMLLATARAARVR